MPKAKGIAKIPTVVAAQQRDDIRKSDSGASMLNG